MDYIALSRHASFASVLLLAPWCVANCRAEVESEYAGRSTLYVTDADPPAAPTQRRQAPNERSGVVFHRPSKHSTVHVEAATDTPPAAHASGGRATLTVVPNADRRQPLLPGDAVFVDDADVSPARYGRSGSGAHSRRPTWSASAEAHRSPSNYKVGGIAQPASARPFQAPNHSLPMGPQSELIVRASDEEDGFPSTQDPRQARETRTAQVSDRDAQQGPVDPAAQWLVEAHELSERAEGQSDYSRVVALCAKAIEADVDGEGASFARTLSAWALNRRGQMRNDESQYELAMADFEAALEADPDNWRALHNRGVTHAQNGDFANAFDDFCRVIQLSPQFPKAYSNRATLYVQAGQPDNALADFDRALELDPKLFAAQVGRGRICHQTGRLHEALEHLNAAIKLDGEHAEVICSRADLHADLGDYAQALADYARAIELQPDFAHAYRNGAWLLATCPDEKFRDPDNAIAGAKQALDFGYGQRHAALDTLAAALASAGRFDDAVDAIQQAIEVAPEEARSAYDVRLRMYESRQPFRISPVEVAEVAGPRLH